MNDQSARNRVLPGAKPGRFLQDEAGAVTVDWVVITGVIVLLGIAAGFAVTANVPGLADEVADYVSEQEIRKE